MPPDRDRVVVAADCRWGVNPGCRNGRIWHAGHSSSTPPHGGAEDSMGTQAEQLRSTREWSAWQPSAPYTVGLEEEVMLLDPVDWTLAQRSDEILPQLPPELAEHVSAEAHHAAVEFATGR